MTHHAKIAVLILAVLIFQSLFYAFLRPPKGD